MMAAMTGAVLICPGQGLQHAGMGRDLAARFEAARDVFRTADEVLGIPLSRLAFEGPEEELARTENAQPALLAHGVAAFTALESRVGPVAPAAAAGHSLGEWTALVLAGSLRLEDALRLVHLRGRLMQEAVPAGEGAMCAVTGLAPDAVEAALAVAGFELGGDVVLAVRNGPGQVVLSGRAAAVARASEVIRDAGASGVVPLAVSAPFHCPLMAPVEEPLRAALAAAEVADPRFPVRSTVFDGWLESAAGIRDALVRQLVRPVLWDLAVTALAETGATRALGLGPAGSLRGMVRRIDRRLSVDVLSTADDVEKASTAIGSPPAV